VLQCLCIGTSCGFTTAWTFSLWQVEQSEISGTPGFFNKPPTLYRYWEPILYFK
jgi:hypothetical protein